MLDNEKKNSVFILKAIKFDKPILKLNYLLFSCFIITCSLHLPWFIFHFGWSILLLSSKAFHTFQICLVITSTMHSFFFTFSPYWITSACAPFPWKTLIPILHLFNFTQASWYLLLTSLVHTLPCTIFILNWSIVLAVPLLGQPVRPARNFHGQLLLEPGSREGLDSHPPLRNIFNHNSYIP